MSNQITRYEYLLQKITTAEQKEIQLKITQEIEHFHYKKQFKNSHSYMKVVFESKLKFPNMINQYSLHEIERLLQIE